MENNPMQTKPKTIEEVLAEFSQKFPHQNYCEHRDDGWRGCICEHNEQVTMLRDTYSAGFAAGIEKAKEFIPEEDGNFTYLSSDVREFAKQLRECLDRLTPPEQK